MNMLRIGAIFEKDLKDFMKNMMLIFMPVLPILLAALYSRVGEGEEIPLFMVYLVIGTTFTAVTYSCLAMMMAEESEKNTLRGLVMSPATMLDVVIGKSLVAIMLTIVSIIISLWLMGFEQFTNFQAIAGLAVALIFFTLLGAGVGMFVKTVASTQIYLMPALFLFGMTPMIEFLGLEKGSVALKIFNTFPLPLLIRMNETGSWSHLGVLSLWLTGAAIFTYICFRRMGRDD